MKHLLFILLIIAILGCKQDNIRFPTVDDDFVFFEVSEIVEDHGDSYILALKDPEDISEARAILSNAETTKIILAEITHESHLNFYPNRDLANEKVWSWHIAEFIEFTDFTIEIYDGWPTYIENNYASWVENTKGSGERGVIGFWNYTITREIDKAELGL